MCEYIVEYIKGDVHPKFIPEKEAYLVDVVARAG